MRILVELRGKQYEIGHGDAGTREHVSYRRYFPSDVLRLAASKPGYPEGPIPHVCLYHKYFDDVVEASDAQTHVLSEIGDGPPSYWKYAWLADEMTWVWTTNHPHYVEKIERLLRDPKAKKENPNDRS